MALVMATSIIASLRRYVWQPSTIIVLAVVLGFNVVLEFDWVQTSSPLIQKRQLCFHRILCWAMPQPLTAKWVRTVEINDQTRPIIGITDRKFLAALIMHAGRALPEVIVLDFKLQSPKGFGKGEDDPSRASQDSELIEAIKSAAQDGVPVIVLRMLGIFLLPRLASDVVFCKVQLVSRFYSPTHVVLRSFSL